MSKEFMKKVKAGKARKRGSGFTGRGFKFDENETKERILENELKRLREKVSTGTAEISELMDVQNELNRIREVKEEEKKKKMKKRTNITSDVNKKDNDNKSSKTFTNANDLAKRLSLQIMGNQPSTTSTTTTNSSSSSSSSAYVETIDINPYPLKARTKVTNKRATDSIMDSTGAIINCKGVYVAPGRSAPVGSQPLHLVIQGRTPIIVKRAVAELTRLLNEATEEELQKSSSFGKYKVI
jgi:ATP-dependent RNA helicase DDX46/PRP5